MRDMNALHNRVSLIKETSRKTDPWKRAWKKKGMDGKKAQQKLRFAGPSVGPVLHIRKVLPAEGLSLLGMSSFRI